MASAPRSAWWRTRRARGLSFQAALLGIVAIVIGGMTLNAMEARQGLPSGFGFLDNTAGFDIIQHLIPYSEESTYARALLVGLLNTLLVAGLGIFFATILGFLIGIGQISQNWLIARLSRTYVEVLRNIPLLLQIFFWYYAVLRAVPGPRESWSLFGAFFLNNRGVYVPGPHPEPGFGFVVFAAALGIAATAWLWDAAARRRETKGEHIQVGAWTAALLITPPIVASMIAGFPMTFSWPELQGFNFEGGIVILPELVALVVALSTYTATYIAEAVRAGIEGIAKGQREAALALGLTRGQTLRLVIIPQAMRQIIPPLTSQYLNLTKNSSLAVAIAYPDLVSVFAGTTLSQTGQAIEVITITMLIYLAISLLTSAFMNWYNARIALTER